MGYILFQRTTVLRKVVRFALIFMLLTPILLHKMSSYNRARNEGNDTTVEKRPHLIFILADDLGFNDVGYHGSEVFTPNINKLAKAGVRLENYYVQPVCSPTRGQFLTGRYGIHTGLNRAIKYRTPLGLSLDDPTIADKLREAGYATHIVGKWHLGHYKSSYLPTSRGFDTFFGFVTGHSDYFTHLTDHQNMYGYDLMENDKPANISKYIGQYSTNLFADKVKNIIRNHNQEKPLFVFLSFQAVHRPVQVPDQYMTKNKHIQNDLRRKYAGMVTCMDEAVGDVVTELKNEGLWDNTVLIFSTDNGASSSTGASNWPLRGMKGNVWEGGIRAVGFVNSPLLDESVLGSVCRELMQVTDWFPTLLNLGGGTANGTNPLDGFDQWNTIKSGKMSPRREILHDLSPRNNESNATLSTLYLHLGAIRVGKWKMIARFNQSIPVAEQFETPLRIELYNIEADPKETTNLLKELPDIVNTMLMKLSAYHKQMVPCPDPEPDLLSDPAFHNGFWGPWKD